MDPRRRAHPALVCGLALWLAAAPGVRAGPAVGIEFLAGIPLVPPDFVQPVAIAAGPFGRLYVADPGRGAVVRLDAGGRALYEFGSPPGQPGLQPLDLEVTGFKVYVLDAQTNAVLRYSDRGSYLDVLQSFRDQNSDTPRAVAVDPTGRLLLADPARHQVRLVDESQRTATVVGGFGASPGEMVRPGGVAFAADGSFYVADTGNGRVQLFSGVGNFVRVCGDSLGEPRGLAVGRQGEIFVADPRRRAVLLLASGGGRRAELRLEHYRPVDVAVVGDTLWVLSAEPAALVRALVLRGD